MTVEKIIEELSKYINENVLDIIIYGSITRGKEEPNDIDIVILYKNTFPIDIITKLGEKYHVIPIKIDDIFSLGHLLIEALAEGWSVVHKRPLREVLGYRAYKEIIIKNIIYGEKRESKRVSLYYFLYGRKDRNKIGLLEETGAEVVSRNPMVILVPIENSEIFKYKLSIFAKTTGIEKLDIIERTVIIGKIDKTIITKE